MNGFKHIKLKNHKGLKVAKLSELGKINVVCGPNNSGKTTTLECIENRKLHSIGILIDDDAIIRINEASMKGRTWTNRTMGDAYPKLLREAASKQMVWFHDEAEYFGNVLQECWKRVFGPNARFELLPDLKNAFLNEFPGAPSVILIPAKRRLETSKNFIFDEIEPAGTGVLNFLFVAKNQDESSNSRKNFDQISAAFEDISAGYEFQVFVQEKSANTNGTKVDLRFRRKGFSWIQAIDCGQGLQELLIILYFALASEHDVVLIEEPENHLHPEIQRRLIAFLREKTEKQFFLSTHSSIFLSILFADRVFTCRMTDSVQIDNATSRARALTELGYSIAENLVSDLIVLCEGPKDTLVLQEFFQKMGLHNRSNIKVWPLGGDTMDQHDLSVFQQSHKLIAVVDNDPGSSVVRKRFVKKCEELKIPVTRLERYSIENYFSISAIASIIKNPISDSITALDPKKKVSEQLGFEVKNMGGKIAKEMKLEDVDGTDFGAFLKQVEALIEKR